MRHIWLWLALAVVAALVLVIWSIRRHRSPILQVETDHGIAQLMPSLAGLSLSTAVAGNAVQVLENGAFYEVLLARIA
ncbi:MAG TPA: hypothetical protein VFE74_02110, partial [Ramlibacter sp.]|nr:hypothetical protein [Ramlibacter sp.]